ncbi:hypothetical protein [Clostridium sp. C105KSO13]|uniref:hypothetical protein n=1 Tax=Clostridium sp. C105KSO13 TaxID=1776045 RepID=UPI0007406645|nr:hypothetical protein [Clostridium sp. C105KSO13]CUX42779.1 hypothetical protein BN3456_02277 [Clostridium sp. C105KSO13]
MATFMMILPATGVSAAKLHRDIKNDENRKVHFVYIGFFVCYIFFIILRITGIIEKQFLNLFANYIVLFPVSILILIFTWIDGGKLDPGKGWKKVKGVLLIFPFTFLLFPCRQLCFLGRSMAGEASFRKKCKGSLAGEQVSSYWGLHGNFGICQYGSAYTMWMVLA